MQPAVYHQPKLHTAPVEGPLDDSESATRERERREVERGFLQELSKYYELGPNQDLWERPALLLKGKHDTTLDMLRHPTYPCSSQCWMISTSLTK